MKIGLVGIGGWGSNHKRVLEKMLADGKIDSFLTCDNDPGKGADYIRLKPFLKQGLDGVIVATPPDSHYKIAKLCMEKGIPVLIEKPVTLEKGQTVELLSMGKIMAGFTFLYHDSMGKLIEHVLVRPPERIECIFSGFKQRDNLTDWENVGPHLLSIIAYLEKSTGKKYDTVFRLDRDGGKARAVILYYELSTPDMVFGFNKPSDPEPLELEINDFLVYIGLDGPPRAGKDIIQRVAEMM